MRALLDRLHARMGDLWWYSLMIFVACRSGDVIQAFIGLWLVPKYVGPKELGAVLPLQQLSGLFAVPLAILATVFAKYVNTYATRGEYGKVKSFIHDVLLAAIGVFVFCIAAAYLIIPHFYLRLNVTSGMLTILILASGFATNIAALFTSALQGLKKFKTMTVQNLISAPIRLVTMLVAMPVRALSGYILGQTTPPATCSILAAFSLHKDLRAIPLDKSWRRDLPEIWRYLWPIAIYTAIGALTGAISNTIYRQRLPEVESAAYYMLSRFAEMAGYIGCSLLVVLVPLASEAHENGQDDSHLLKKSILLNLLSAFLFTIIFTFSSKFIFTLNAQWSCYQAFAHLLPLLTITIGIAQIPAAIISYEIACRRFILPILFVIYHLMATAVFVSISGFEIFRGVFSDVLVNKITAWNFNNLSTYCWYSFGVTVLGVILSLILVSHRKRRL